MKKYGLEKSDYGHIAIAQREWAANNPYAVYRTPLTMEEYLAAPLVADPLSRYDCVPVVAGAQAIIVARPDRAPKGRPGVRVRAHRAQLQLRQPGGRRACRPASARSPTSCGRRPACGRTTSTSPASTTTIRPWCWRRPTISASSPATISRASAASTIGEQRFPVNTWGGMLSAGQPGGHAGGLNGISEAVLQLQHRAGERQVKDARLAVATGYGMTMYRYGGTAARGDPGARGMSDGRHHLALRELPRRIFPGAAAVPALSRRHVRRPIACTRRWSRRSPSSAT